MKRFFARKATQYIFFEMVPSFLLGLLVFIFILLMFQALRYTEFILVHGVKIATVGEIMGYLSISFLPAILPMAILFSVLMSYGRLSADSEMTALKACGLNMGTIAFPAVVLGVIVAVFSAQTTFHLAPWGNRQFELLITKLSQTKAGATLREGTFSEGFFDLVVYANKVDSKAGELTKVFIYDERQADAPLAIIAKSGQLIQDKNNPGHSILLHLRDGDIHRKSETHTKIKFNAFDIHLFDPIKQETRSKSSQSLTIEEISERLKEPGLTEETTRTLRVEFHKRWAISIVCLIFALLGVGIGTNTDRRSQKGNGMVKCLGIIVFYWILLVSFEGLARNGQLSPVIAAWTPNLYFAGLTAWTLRKNWN